jgi:hypothetical protein
MQIFICTRQQEDPIIYKKLVSSNVSQSTKHRDLEALAELARNRPKVVIFTPCRMSPRSDVAKQFILDPTHRPGLGQDAIADVGPHRKARARASGCKRRVLDSSVSSG